MSDAIKTHAVNAFAGYLDELRKNLVFVDRLATFQLEYSRAINLAFDT